MIEEKLLLYESQDDNRALRPHDFNDYIGQGELLDKLRIAIQAANEREDPLDHLLLTGPPGLGKTSIAYVIANECGVPIRTIMAPSLKNTADLLEILVKLDDRGILFIDEIHALNKKTEESLYSAMEDFLVSQKLQNKEYLDIPLRPFCLIGATTCPGKIAAPLRDRFGIHYGMSFYTDNELMIIISANAKKLKLNIKDENALMLLATKSRGTPRIANRLLRRVRDFAQVQNNNVVNIDSVSEALRLEGIDGNGLTKMDRRYMYILFKIFSGGPARTTCSIMLYGRRR